MHSPTASSGTAWMEPPVARAVATARSPSAGLPIASERATVAGRTGRTAAPASKAVATGAHPAAWPPTSRGDVPSARPRSSSSVNAWFELREERAGRDRRDDDVWRPPAELLGDLVGDRLRALGVVAAQADVDERPRHLPRELDRHPVAVVVGAGDRVQRRPVGGGRGQLLRLEVGRAEDRRLEPLGRRAGRDRVREVAGGRAGERRQAELLRLRRRDRDHAVLERVRRVGGVELQPELADAELLGEPRRRGRAA